MADGEDKRPLMDQAGRKQNREKSRSGSSTWLSGTTSKSPSRTLRGQRSGVAGALAKPKRRLLGALGPQSCEMPRRHDRDGPIPYVNGASAGHKDLVLFFLDKRLVGAKPSPCITRHDGLHGH
jgi:hypothetical protein